MDHTRPGGANCTAAIEPVAVRLFHALEELVVDLADGVNVGRFYHSTCTTPSPRSLFGHTPNPLPVYNLPRASLTAHCIILGFTTGVHTRHTLPWAALHLRIWIPKALPSTGGCLI